MTAPRPYTLVAELTYRCPLRCPYCSNPLDWAKRRDALATEDWLRVLREAEALGVVSLNLSGGEPLLREDLETILREARALDLYTTLITSGLPCTEARLRSLAEAGLDAVQLSVQDVREEASDRIAGTRSFAHKRAFAGWVKALGLPLTLNIVLHRHNIAHVAEAIALAEELGAERLELANTQYLGWALPNRAALLPSPQQVAAARDVAIAARERLRGRMDILFVLPDYLADRPRPCMDGWGQRFIVVTPDGFALPCHAAHSLPGVAWDKVTERPLGEIWRDSRGFNLFRGTEWMREPCRSCDRRLKDHGGCRCQAFALTGDAAATDPACALSPDHRRVRAAREEARVRQTTFLYRAARPPAG
ncbi:MAG: pyrroloquinoline quinone biosynthesis protein PqqE [Acetobacteraceae bacterium]|nr:pyrroloquinoline quinone biosynthesis protein PqqE [Acetobacteraceae bacterium]